MEHTQRGTEMTDKHQERLAVAELRYEWDQLPDDEKDRITDEFLMDMFLGDREPSEKWYPLLMPGFSKGPSTADPLHKDYSGDLTVSDDYKKEIDALYGNKPLTIWYDPAILLQKGGPTKQELHRHLADLGGREQKSRAQRKINKRKQST